MSKRALFESLPGDIVLNSLFIPGQGGTHFVSGYSHSKLAALADVHKHLEHAFWVDQANPRWSPVSGDLTSHFKWDDIKPRQPHYWGRSNNPGAFTGGQGTILPIRSQKGVETNLLLSFRPVQAKIFEDDYATGKIPWTISMSKVNEEDFDKEHARLRDYFNDLGNTKMSWRERYNVR